MDILIGILIEWLALNTSMDIKNPPHVVLKDSLELEQMSGFPVHGLYDRESKTIYVSGDVDLSTIQGASVLLHELVHHYQNVSGAMGAYNCSQESEKLAYETQRDYLEANKAELMPELNGFNIAMRSLCPSFFY